LHQHALAGREALVAGDEPRKAAEVLGRTRERRTLRLRGTSY